MRAASSDVLARRRPPAAVFLAVPLAVLSALVLGVFGLIALAFSNGHFDGGGWLVIAVPVVLALWLVAGAVLLALGRSWLAVFLPAAGLAGLLLWIILAEGLVAGTDGFAVLVWALPAATAVFAVLPVVRSWIAARRMLRRTAS